MHWAKINGNLVDFSVKELNRHPVLEAAEFTIADIIKNYPAPYNLMVSGGIDSQAMLYLWNKFGSNFIPTSVIYNSNLNLYDVMDLNNLNLQYDFKINYINFDILSFYEKEVHDYALKYKCSSPCINAHIKMSENLQGTVIFSGDFIAAQKPVLSNAILGLYRASLQRENLIPYFFLHTPELAYSMQKPLKSEPNYNDVEHVGYDFKIENYKNNHLPITPQKQKSTGFEKIKDIYDEKYYHLVPPLNRLRFAKKPSKRTFDLLLRYPYEIMFGDQPLQFIINKLG
jgi:hypothetical protein